jgi:hypothetical protein
LEAENAALRKENATLRAKLALSAGAGAHTVLHAEAGMIVKDAVR